jgi:hypothetical protein
VAELQNGTNDERAERLRLTRVLRFTDLIALLLALATSIQAFAAWRIYLVTNQMLQVSDRPYLGVQHVSLDVSDPQVPKVVVEYRNYGPVAAEDAVLERWVTVDGNPTAGPGHDEKIQLGVLSPQVPHFSYSLLPPAATRAIIEGKSALVATVKFSYTDPLGVSLCYRMSFHYDRYLKNFQVAGGSARCEVTSSP